MNKKTTEIKRSNALINAFYNMSVDTYKVFSLAASKFKDQIFYDDSITQQDIFRVVIEREEIESIFSSFRKSHLIKKRFNQIAKETKANSAIAIPITNGDEVGFKFIPIIDSIVHNPITQQIVMTFRPEAKEHLNPDSEKGNFDLDDVKNLGFITSMKQVPIYNICHKNIGLGSVTKTIKELRKLTNTSEDKYQLTGHFINRVIKYQVDVINENSILEIEIIPIKTGRKITHIKFKMLNKSNHPLEEINQESDNIKAQLINLGFNKSKLETLLKTPSEILIQAINETQKAKAKGFKKSMEACFFWQIKHLSENTDTKIQPYQLVQLFKDNLSIETKQGLWNEFYAQLNEKEQQTYSQANKNQNKTIKQALENDFNSKYNKWIYETKIKNKGEK